MAGKKRERVAEKDVTGLKYFDKLAPLLARLHDDACHRDKAGNRQLHFDQYIMLVLLFLFNPLVSSLRAIVQASELKKVQRRLGCQRASLGSLSEAACVFDAGRLKGIVEELGEPLEPVGQDARLKHVQNTLTLVNKIHSRGSSYVCRLRDNSSYEVIEERPLSEAAKAAGIVFDGMVCYYFIGLADEEELLAHLAKLKAADG